MSLRVIALFAAAAVIHSNALAQSGGATKPHLVLGSVGMQIGGQSSDANEQFGKIGGIAADASGRTYILDSQLNQVRIFASTGQYLATAGGPGQLFVPVALTLVDTKPGVVAVLDARARKIAEFSTRPRSGAMPGEISLRTSGTSLCAMRGRFYVLGLNDGTIVHVVDSTGSERSGFGVPFGSDDALDQASLAHGIIACVESTQTLIVAPDLLGEVRAYSPDGHLKWLLKLPDYQGVLITRTPGRLSFTAPTGGFDQLLAVASVSPNLVVIQVGHIVPSANSPDSLASTRTFFISTSKGTIVNIQPSLPRLGFIRLPYVYTMSNDPSPRVTRIAADLRGAN